MSLMPARFVEGILLVRLGRFMALSNTFKDGVRRVDHVSIKFCDEENANLCALVKHNEALRKGEVNAES